jgi:hypothetical protein
MADATAAAGIADRLQNPLRTGRLANVDIGGGLRAADWHAYTRNRFITDKRFLSPIREYTGETFRAL